MRSAADVPTTRLQDMEPAAPYGMELVLDMHDCDPTRFNRSDLGIFFVDLCELLVMDRGPLHFWDYQGAERAKARAPAHMKGTTAVQFIYTSNITVHTLDDLRRVYLNIFSCREFDVSQAADFATRYFGAGWCSRRVFQRS